MSKTIVFPEPFESRLKTLRCKTRFIKNRRAYVTRNKNYVGSILNTTSDLETLFFFEKTWQNTIANSFSWSSTKEGYSYWEKVCISYYD